jgi:hypothetical protein
MMMEMIVTMEGVTIMMAIGMMVRPGRGWRYECRATRDDDGGKHSVQ